MDFLGLRTLTVIRDALLMIRQGRGIDVDIDHLDFSDQKVYEMISSRNTEGEFQLESEGMTNLMTRLQRKTSGYHGGHFPVPPGTMAKIPEYIDCKRHPEHVHYDHPFWRKF